MSAPLAHRRTLRPIRVAYALRNGTRGVLTCMAPSTSDAVLRAIDIYGEQLCACSATAMRAHIHRGPSHAA